MPDLSATAGSPAGSGKTGELGHWGADMVAAPGGLKGDRQLRLELAILFLL